MQERKNDLKIKDFLVQIMQCYYNSEEFLQSVEKEENYIRE